MNKQNMFEHHGPRDNIKLRGSYHIESPDEEWHHSKLGAYAFGLWKKDMYTDITVKLNGKSYKAHRPVLSCHSTYFKEHISKANNNVIQLDKFSITSESFEILLYFMYTGRLAITVENIGDVYIASQKLGIKKVFNTCEDILLGKVRREVQCVYLFATAIKLKEIDGARKAFEVMAWNFEHIVGTKEFLDLKFDAVVEYLSFDNLAVRSEIIVYLAALKWLNYKFLDREIYIERIIGCVRFPLMTLNEIMACFSPPLLPGIIEIPAIEYMLLTGLSYVASKTVDEQRHLRKYSCKSRQYLLGRMPVVLWDSNIFNPIRHSQYRKETAATAVQSGYRRHVARCEKKELSFLYNNTSPKIVKKSGTFKSLSNEIKQVGGLTSQTKIRFMIGTQPSEKNGVIKSPLVEKTKSFISQPFISAQFNINSNDENLLSKDIHTTKQSSSISKVSEKSRSNKNITSGDKIFKTILNKAKATFKSIHNEILPNVRPLTPTKISSLENIPSVKKQVEELPQSKATHGLGKQKKTKQTYISASSPLNDSKYFPESESNNTFFELVKSLCENCCSQLIVPSEMSTSDTKIQSETSTFPTISVKTMSSETNETNQTSKTLLTERSYTTGTKLNGKRDVNKSMLFEGHTPLIKSVQLTRKLSLDENLLKRNFHTTEYSPLNAKIPSIGNMLNEKNYINEMERREIIQGAGRQPTETSISTSNSQNESFYSNVTVSTDKSYLTVSETNHVFYGPLKYYSQLTVPNKMSSSDSGTQSERSSSDSGTQSERSSSDTET